MPYTSRDLIDDLDYTKHLQKEEKARQLRLQREFARKEKEIGRKLNDSERNYFSQFNGYPASQQERVRNMSFADLQTQRNFASAQERERRIKEARNRTPLENAIRRWFTPVKNQIPEKYLK
jgi:hypothetical protein